MAGREGGGRDGQTHTLGHHDAPSTSLHTDGSEKGKNRVILLEGGLKEQLSFFSVEVTDVVQGSS